jgi:hypothetical protein
VLAIRLVKEEKLMKQVTYLLTLLILPLLIVACSTEDSAGPGTPQEPAMIMFYTDN